jgi:hypothetical protein
VAGGNVIAVALVAALALAFGAALALAAALEEADVFVAVDSLLSQAARTKTAEAMRRVRMAGEARRMIALNQQYSWSVEPPGPTAANRPLDLPTHALLPSGHP